jgi:hypothetical protein
VARTLTEPTASLIALVSRAIREAERDSASKLDRVDDRLAGRTLQALETSLEGVPVGIHERAEQPKRCLEWDSTSAFCLLSGTLQASTSEVKINLHNRLEWLSTGLCKQSLY